MTQDYLIEALAPLVFRSGKPFGSAGRRRWRRFSDCHRASRDCCAPCTPTSTSSPFSRELRQIAAAGPLLAKRRARTAASACCCPSRQTRSTCVITRSIEVIRQSPAKLPPETGCDLRPDLLPLQMTLRIDGKPAPGPQYWPLASLHAWSDGASVTFTTLQEEGLCALSAEERTHVALDDQTLASDDGRLFQTGGIDLAPHREAEGWQTHDLVFLARSTAQVEKTLATFGGERRLSRLHPCPPTHWPAPPEALAARIRAQGGLRLTLATPAIFSGGHLPGWLDARTLIGAPPDCPDLSLQLKAVAVERWLPVSGWDLAAGKPRAMRKAVASGAVYWFAVQGELPADFVERLWLQPISDHPQDRLDGFGLALPGPWNPSA
jgi:CRISPR-associated protein Cmr3